jgi:flagellar motor switch protein FliG
MFVFEDMAKLSDADIQRVLRDTVPKDLVYALISASDDVKKEVFGNMSKRTADSIKEEIISAGEVDAAVIEAAQQKFANKMTELGNAGVIKHPYSNIVDSELMKIFEGITKLSDADIQRLLRDIAPKDLVYALIPVGDDVKQALFNNMSKRTANAIREEMRYAGRVDAALIGAAQQRIVSKITELGNAGMIKPLGG